MGYNMSMTQPHLKDLEEIIREIKSLPRFLQEEALDFITYLKLKTIKNSQDDKDWNHLSLKGALRGMENDEFPIYQESDLKEQWS